MLTSTYATAPPHWVRAHWASTCRTCLRRTLPLLHCTAWVHALGSGVQCLPRRVPRLHRQELETEDVAVIVDAKHMCVSSRGVGDESSSTVTADYRGAFRNAETRAELRERLGEWLRGVAKRAVAAARGKYEGVHAQQKKAATGDRRS